MEILIIVFILLAAYLIGAIPTAVWVGKSFYGVDVRQHGSGNAGATNTFRVLGKKPGAFVMAVDIFKGWAATSLAHVLVMSGAIAPDKLILFKIMLGVVLKARIIYFGNLWVLCQPGCQLCGIIALTLNA